jgi:hypothetical protein
MKILSISLLTTLLCASCSIVQTKDQGMIVGTKDLSELQTVDYIDHLASMGYDYLHHTDVKEISLNKNARNYFDRVFSRIVSNNEIFFDNKESPEIHIIKDSTPFFFSLPKSQFFFSSGLFKKYLKSEELFISVLALEIIKSKRQIYEKKQIIPLGFCSTESMIHLTRVSPANRYQLNEWNYLVLKRAGYDASVSLNWIQVQNRNILDFVMLLGDTLSISKEEYYFKNFMAKEGVATVERKTIEANSSKDYYQLMNQIASTK